MRTMRASLLNALPLLLPLLLRLDGASAQCPDANWTHVDEWCYKWFSDPTDQFLAEETCVSHGGHLASIWSEQENRLVGRLSHCTDAWIGLFGLFLDQLTDPRTYIWMDGSETGSFEKHNFSQLNSGPSDLVRTDGEWWRNSLRDEQHPFVCKSVESEQHEKSPNKQQCPSGWSLHDRHCYLMPQFEANFDEANFYCQRNSSHLVSVLSESELRFIKRLTFAIDGCEPQSQQLDSVWLGLIKLNSCSPDSAVREICYQWTDFSGELGAVPAWEDGHPNKADWTVNCVTLSVGRLRSKRCHKRHRFVCKASVYSATRLTSTRTRPPPLGLEAAFDFRRSLDNLVNSSTYVIEDSFGVRRTAKDGACFGLNQSDRFISEFYRVGDRVPYNESILVSGEWTMYFRLNIRSSDSSFDSSSDSVSYFLGIENVGSSSSRFMVSYGVGLVKEGSLMKTIVEWAKPMNSSMNVNYYSTHNYTDRNCLDSWCDVRLAGKRDQMNVTIDGELGSGEFNQRLNSVMRGFDLQQILIGHIYAELDWLPELCIRCFGFARRHLSEEEVGRAMSVFCPTDSV